MNADNLGNHPTTFNMFGDFDAMLKSVEERRQLLDSYLGTVPQSIPCEQHPEQLRTVDAKKSDIGEAAYGECPACLAVRLREEKERYEAAARIRAMHDAGIPPVLHHATLANWQPTPNIPPSHREHITDFVKARRGFLIMTGKVGTGKSHLAVGAMVAFGVSSARLITHADFMRKLRLHYNDDHKEDIVETCLGVGLLVLDDVGLAVGGKDELPTIHRVLDHRHSHRKPTIITTNKSVDGLAEFLGERMTDRLAESCKEVLEFKGKSHRSQMRESYFSRP
jgi:DNA replication protein DnaC